MLGRKGLRPVIGIIANPVSARDIRRVVANAASLQIADRANIVLRVLAGLAACGIEQVLMMPDRGGIASHVSRGIERSRNQGEHRFPRISYLDMPVTGTVEDTRCAARLLRKAHVASIIVLGGDGTHRAVVSECTTIPIAGISTGTNNAFPEHREPTVTGLATGLAAMGRVPGGTAFATNKMISVVVGSTADIALVDAAFVTDGYAGARAVWRMHTLRELFVTFADPEVIGLAAIAGLIEPVSRRSSGGLMVRFVPPQKAVMALAAPIAPGLVEIVGVDDWRRMPPGVPFAPTLASGSIALDGERELSFTERDEVSVSLIDNAFLTVDVAAIMKFSAVHGLMRQSERPQAESLT
jgi:predicted polyphosphate/ATP-dependent NAD kinase